MDGRISAALFLFTMPLVCAGCVTTQTPTNVANPATSTSSESTKVDEMPKVVKKADGPKRDPLPATEIAFGLIREQDADTEAAKANPEAQARMRDEARKAYQHALKLDPNKLDAYRHLGRIYGKMSDFDRANEIYQKALAKFPKDATLWYDVGLFHLRKKEFSEGVRCFNKALEFDPENRECMKKLGFTLAWMQQYDQGLVWLTRAQGSAQAHFNIARILLDRNQNELARQHLQTAVRENGQLEEARALLDHLEGRTANPARQ